LVTLELDLPQEKEMKVWTSCIKLKLEKPEFDRALATLLEGAVELIKQIKLPTSLKMSNLEAIEDISTQWLTFSLDERRQCVAALRAFLAMARFVQTENQLIGLPIHTAVFYFVSTVLSIADLDFLADNPDGV